MLIITILGKIAGQTFRESELLGNPVTGLMIGVLATVLLQSSSTTTSIIITMVGAKLIPLQNSIPMVMGANIGTSVTNTIVSLAQSGDRQEFRKAFGGATVHDMFNWLSVLILLPLEVATHYLYHLTGAIVESLNLKESSNYKKDMLKKLTKPFTNLIVQGNHLFAMTDLSDSVVGAILLVLSLVLIILSLIFIVKLLNSLLKSPLSKILNRTINAELPGKLAILTGYIAILVGTGVTMVIQSSSVFTSTLTPLVGVGILSIDRMLPLTLGANIGTTLTGILAALAAPAKAIPDTLRVALCHLFFNISGVLIFYPIPFMRKAPIGLAKLLGNTTAKYRWFSVLYILITFVFIPSSVFALSLSGPTIFMAIGIPLLSILIIIIVINIIQKYRARILPNFCKHGIFCHYSCIPCNLMTK
ncbi:hypothetical protein KUTeg_018813 [Tegillarca granosa]|uniref:Sodium-dependent phosphate transporter n=1 Tax=Tegillarca granosa TaxID=220873 RepID=A0ABQ9EET8_TEGGR|nr:hypothetical protein KUTeg_018813 [Tegillarca granosa]